MYKCLPLLFISLLIACSNPPKSGSLHLNPLFSDGMVLQQKEAVTIWGTSSPNEKIAIKASWGKTAEAIAGKDGNWKTTLETPEAGGPFELNIKSDSDQKTIKEVLIGEVWLAAGQSNMEMTFNYCCNTTDSSAHEIATANYPDIRMITVQKQMSMQPRSHFAGSWEKAVGENITDFSAPAYFFAKKLHRELNVPIGIVHASWGGTDAEAWTSREKLGTLGHYDEALEGYDQLVEEASRSDEWFSQFEAVKIPSDIWYLYLGDSLGFPDKWDKLDVKDETYLQPGTDFDTGQKISLPGPFDHLSPEGKFNGMVLFKKSFKLAELKGDYSLKLGPVGNMDFTYVNGAKIGSTKGKPSTLDKVYQIPEGLLKAGENEIAIRVLNQYGEGKVGAVAIASSEGEEIILDGEWNYRISAEIHRQLDNLAWPYQSLYIYEDADTDFSQRPPNKQFHQNVVSALFNGMINPLVPYNIKGAIWYQGENNVNRHDQYQALFTSMITDWRERWGNDFPFYFVQIAPYYGYGGLSSSLRDSQRKSLSLPKTGMVVTLDISELYDIHPSNKHDVGYRLAGLALAKDYGKQVIASGPLYKGHQQNGNKVLVEFDYVGSGLILRENGQGSMGFEVAGADQDFVPARAKIVGKQVEIYSPKVAMPVHLRYAWADTSTATLFNVEGLPASSFSSE